MKAKIKATGEIINIASYATITLDKCNSYGTPIEVRPEDIELIADVEEDSYWQNMRIQAAIAAMQGALANCYLHHVSNNIPCSSIAKYSALYANALIKELKKK